MKKLILVGAAVAAIIGMVCAADCNKVPEQMPQTNAVVKAYVPVTNACCSCEYCCDCCKCKGGKRECRCGCCMEDSAVNVVVTKEVTVKEYSVGGSLFGAGVVVSKKTETPPPPPPPTCQVWIEGYWGVGMMQNGCYIRRWVPGHYETCTVVY